MPSSPLVEPGWPSSLPKGPDIAGKFMSAFAIGSQVNARQRQLENQLAAMSLRERQMELNHELQRDKYDLAVQKLQMSNEVANARLALQAEDNALDRKKYDLAFNKVMDIQEAKEGLIDAEAQLAAEGLKPGDKKYMARFNELTAPFIGKVPNNIFKSIYSRAENNQKGAAALHQRYYDSEYKHFLDDASSTLYGNDNPPNPDLTPILHPEVLDVEETKVGGNWWSGYQYKPTGNKIIPYTDRAGVAKERPVSVADLNRLKNRYNELMKIKSELAPVDEPSMPIPLPSNKAELQPNTVYETPRGNLRWTGTGFIAP